MLELKREQEALLKIQQATKEMEKSKEKRVANARLLSDELDKIPTKQSAQSKTLLKRQPKSVAAINFKSAPRPVVQPKQSAAILKEEKTLSDKSTTQSELTPKISDKQVSLKPIAPLNKMGG